MWKIALIFSACSFFILDVSFRRSAIDVCHSMSHSFGIFHAQLSMSRILMHAHRVFSPPILKKICNSNKFRQHFQYKIHGWWYSSVPFCRTSGSAQSNEDHRIARRVLTARNHLVLSIFLMSRIAHAKSNLRVNNTDIYKSCTSLLWYGLRNYKLKAMSE